ncbi:hypothetical protein EYF80_046838 [Liparis tanakae]|uniref:Uncharacterized protein n=1 Tax=Liparis tanakae TaxID=230148 RepID=A0A4Z2FQI9_9TELE|nr:hypothetical protein EYF80_046838 [Liparis tanakae]
MKLPKANGYGKRRLLTLLRPGLPLLHVLHEQVERLRLDELLHKVPRGLGVDGLVEAPLLEHALAAAAPVLHVGAVVAHGPHEEMQEGLRHDAVHLLHRWNGRGRED